MPSATLPVRRQRGPEAWQLGGPAVRVASPAGPQGPRPRDRSPQSGPRTGRLLGPPGAQLTPLGAQAGAHRGHRAPEARRYAAGPPSCLGPRPTPSAAGQRHPPGAEQTAPQAALVLPPGPILSGGGARTTRPKRWRIGTAAGAAFCSTTGAWWARDLSQASAPPSGTYAGWDRASKKASSRRRRPGSTVAGSASAASSTALAAPAQKAGPAPSAKQPCTQVATKRLGSNALQRPGVAEIRLKARRKMRWGVPASRCAKARTSSVSCRAGRSAREAACQAAAASPRASKSDPP